MKINKFFLFFLIIFTNNISNSFANEDVVQKGLEIFNGKGQCAVCHILKDAGSQGNIGPNLDMVVVSLESVKNIVINGQGVMPALGLDGILTQDEVDIVSQYVVNVANK